MVNANIRPKIKTLLDYEAGEKRPRMSIVRLREMLMSEYNCDLDKIAGEERLQIPLMLAQLGFKVQGNYIQTFCPDEDNEAARDVISLMQRTEVKSKRNYSFPRHNSSAEIKSFMRGPDKGPYDGLQSFNLSSAAAPSSHVFNAFVNSMPVPMNRCSSVNSFNAADSIKLRRFNQSNVDLGTQSRSNHSNSSRGSQGRVRSRSRSGSQQKVNQFASSASSRGSFGGSNRARDFGSRFGSPTNFSRAISQLQPTPIATHHTHDIPIGPFRARQLSRQTAESTLFNESGFTNDVDDVTSNLLRVNLHNRPPEQAPLRFTGNRPDVGFMGSRSDGRTAEPAPFTYNDLQSPSFESHTSRVEPAPSLYVEVRNTPENVQSASSRASHHNKQPEQTPAPFTNVPNWTDVGFMGSSRSGSRATEPTPFSYNDRQSPHASRVEPAPFLYNETRNARENVHSDSFSSSHVSQHNREMEQAQLRFNNSYNRADAAGNAQRMDGRTAEPAPFSYNDPQLSTVSPHASRVEPAPFLYNEVRTAPNHAPSAPFSSSPASHTSEPQPTRPSYNERVPANAVSRTRVLPAPVIPTGIFSINASEFFPADICKNAFDYHRRGFNSDEAARLLDFSDAGLIMLKDIR